MEKHGRKLSDPWSLRQAGVYHQQRGVSGNSSVSRWLFLNLPEQLKLLLQETYESNRDCCNMTLHADLLSTASINWNEYIEYLALELRNHVSRITQKHASNPYRLTHLDRHSLLFEN